MDVFQRNYNTYYHILRFTGLWPFDESIFSKIQRTVFSVLILCCIVIQLSTLHHVEITLSNILTSLSYTFPMLLFFLRYLGFAANFSIVKTILQDLQNDCTAIKSPVEVKILTKHMEKTRRIFQVFLGVSVLGIIFITIRIVVPTVLGLKSQLNYLRFYGFFYSEKCRQADFASIHLTLTSAIGLLTIACTEGSLAVFSLYFCGLFEIVGSRMRIAINSTARLITSKEIDIGPAVELHQRALKLTQTIMEDMTLSYLMAIVVVIVSFALNMYRAFQLLMEGKELDETATAILVVVTHLVIMFLNNYSGQQLSNISINVFDETYNAMWYTMPPKSQKLLLLVMMKSGTEVQFNLAGLFVPCYEGFTMMMSSSFSYFTLLYSV